ncbi:MAG: glycine-rich protein [Candidatus Cybelea sp.]
MKILGLSRHALTMGAATALLAGCGGSPPPTIALGVSTDNGDALRYHKTFHYTGAAQSFKVPAGVTSINVDVRGAAGAGYYVSYHGGRGGRVMATIAVHPGRTFHVFVGGEGSKDKGGFNGGGNGGANASCDYGWGGGGASDVRVGGDMLPDRILVAGGGGGSGTNFNGSGPSGGSGGGKTGGNGTSPSSGGGGGGGNQHKGGRGGDGGAEGRGHGYHGTSGQLGVGGIGGVCGHSHYSGGSGGGGGGGYFGGGRGGGGHYLNAGGGAGGGSGYIESKAIKPRMWRVWETANGNGLVVFSWQ